MKDPIERRDAIGAVLKLTYADGAYGYADAKDLVDSLEDLPSAQPEIILCKDCKEFRRWIDTDITFCDRTESEVKEGDFCSRAERRKSEYASKKHYKL